MPSSLISFSYTTTTDQRSPVLINNSNTNKCFEARVNCLRRLGKFKVDEHEFQIQVDVVVNLKYICSYVSADLRDCPVELVKIHNF